jgi:hypothetical protein
MVFISYKHDDQEFALQVYDRVVAAGLPHWIDLNIEAGERWKPAIDNAIKRSDAMIVIVTPKSLLSSYVTYEWSFALGLNKIVIPVILEFPKHNNGKNKWHPKEIHPQLYDIQRFDFSKPDKQPWDELIERLLNLDIVEDMPPEVREAADGIYKPSIQLLRDSIAVLQHHPHPSSTKVLERASHEAYAQISGRAGIALAHKTNLKNKHALFGLQNALEIPDTRRDAINILSAMNSDDAVEILSSDFDRLISLKRDHDASEIMQAVVQITTPAVLDLMIKMCTTPGVFYTLLFDAMANFKDERVLPAFSFVLKNHNLVGDGLVRLASAIGKLNLPSGVPILDQILSKIQGLHYYEDQQVFQATIKALADIGGDQAKQVVLAARHNRKFSEGQREIFNALERIDPINPGY